MGHNQHPDLGVSIFSTSIYEYIQQRIIQSAVANRRKPACHDTCLSELITPSLKPPQTTSALPPLPPLTTTTTHTHTLPHMQARTHMHGHIHPHICARVQVPADDEELGEDDMEELQAIIEADYEVGVGGGGVLGQALLYHTPRTGSATSFRNLYQ